MTINRRQFLKNGLYTLTALMIPDLLPQTQLLAQTAVIFHGREDLPHVCLTYDDMWDEEMTLKIATAFAEKELSATFFPAGLSITANIDNPTDGHNDLYKKLLDMGHEFGCHLYTHTNITTYDQRYLKWWEIEPWLDELERALGKPYEPVAIRPPLGIVTDPLYNIAVEYNLPIVLWNSEADDTSCREDCDDILLSHFTESLKNGAIYLYHTLEQSFNIIETQFDILAEANIESVPLSIMLEALKKKSG